MMPAPVVVIGAGPTGMVAAALLARYGIAISLFERESAVIEIPRAVHFDEEVMRIFHWAGFGAAARSVATPIRGMLLVDAERTRLFGFEREGIGPHGFSRSNAFDQPELETAMRASLASVPGVNLRSGVSVEAVEPMGDEFRVTVRTIATGELETLRASAVLGCDGARSRTRSFVGGGLEDLGFDSRWAVIDVDADAPLAIYEGVLQVCDPTRPTTYVYVGRGRHRWEFMLGPGDTTESMLDEGFARNLLRPWLGANATTVKLRRRAVYDFHALVARRYRRGRLFLLGDAAHQTPPFIGQGLGAGVRDAANLAWKLAWVLRGRASERLLDTYQDERRPHVRSVIQRAVLLGKVMQSRSGSRLRDRIMRQGDRLEALRDVLVRGAFPTYARGLAVGLAGSRSRAPGTHAPRALALDDDELGHELSVVLHSSVDERRVVTPRAHIVSARRDASGQLDAWLETHACEAALVRPDRVVMAAGRARDVPTWFGDIDRSALFS